MSECQKCAASEEKNKGLGAIINNQANKINDLELTRDCLEARLAKTEKIARSKPFISADASLWAKERDSVEVLEAKLATCKSTGLALAEQNVNQRQELARLNMRLTEEKKARERMTKGLEYYAEMATVEYGYSGHIAQQILRKEKENV